MGFLTDFRVASGAPTPKPLPPRPAQAPATPPATPPATNVAPVPAPAQPAPETPIAAPGETATTAPAAATTLPLSAYPPPATAPPLSAYPPPSAPTLPSPGYAAAPPPAYGPPAASAYPPVGAGPSGPRRLLSGWVPVTALAVVVAVVLAVAFLLPARHDPSLKGLTPQQIMQTSLAAAGKSGSFHLSVLASDGSQTQTVNGDISAAGGTMSSTVGGETLSVMSVGGTEYFKGGTKFWAAVPGIRPGEAALLGGRWLSTPAGDGSPMAQIGDVLQTANVVNEILDLSGPIAEQSVDSAAGTVTLTGTIPTNKLTDGSGAGDQGTLVISDRSPFRPVSLSYSDPQNGSTQLEFSKWGEKVALSAPASSVPLSQLSTGGSGSGSGSSGAAAARQAQMNLRNALTAELTYFTSNQQFDTSSAAALSELEPSLDFVTAGTVTPGSAVLIGADHDAVVLTAAAANGNCYSIESIAQPGGPVPVGTYYYQSPGTGQGGHTTCRVPPKLVESLRAAPSHPSAAASPGTWSLGF